MVPLALAGCTSIGDFGRLQAPLVTDDIHAWVGQEAAANAGAPISFNNLTDDVVVNRPREIGVLIAYIF